MKSVDFLGANGEFADVAGNKVPAFRSKDAKGIVVSCWRPGFWERVYILFFGKIWFAQANYNARQKPFIITVNKLEVMRTESIRQKGDIPPTATPTEKDKPVMKKVIDL